MCILVQPFGMWWMPKRFAMLDSNVEKATRITEKGIAYICLLALTISLFGQWALEFLLTDTYTPASQLLTGAIFMVLGKEYCELLNLGLLKQKKTSTLFYINLVSAIFAIIAMMVTYQYGIWSIILTVGITQLLRAIAIFAFSQRSFRLPYNTYKLGIILAITLVGMATLNSSASIVTMLFTWVVTCFGIIISVVPNKIRIFSSLSKLTSDSKAL